MAGGGELGHVEADLGDDHLGGPEVRIFGLDAEIVGRQRQAWQQVTDTFARAELRATGELCDIQARAYRSSGEDHDPIF